MGFFFLDDSNHPTAGFCLCSFVFTVSDPQKDIESLLLKHGLVPGQDEYKSSIRMDQTAANSAIREDLKDYLRANCKVGVATSPNSEALHEDAALLFQKMLTHPDVGSGNHLVFTDKGIFPGFKEQAVIVPIPGADMCAFHFEQDSKRVCGIQLADLSAHICAIMLKDALGFVTKTVKAGENSGYDPDLDIELGFAMFATIRYAFLGVFAPYVEAPPSGFLQPMLLISDYGLQVSNKLNANIKSAAAGRFESLYLGCIH